MRLATFNILHGKSLSDGRVDLDRFAEAITALDADILALQEVDPDPGTAGAELMTVAAKAMGATDHLYAATRSSTREIWTAPTGEQQPPDAAYGVAVLSRFPVLAWHVVPLPELVGRVPMMPPERRYPVLVHDDVRSGLVALVDTPEGRLTVVATHLAVVPGWNLTQLRRLARRCAGAPRPLVLLGDLNVPGPFPEWVTGWRSFARLRTYPVGRPNRQLDHVLGDGRVRATSEARALDLGVSDHRAVVVDVALGD